MCKPVSGVVARDALMILYQHHRKRNEPTEQRLERKVDREPVRQIFDPVSLSDNSHSREKMQNSAFEHHREFTFELKEPTVGEAASFLCALRTSS